MKTYLLDIAERATKTAAQSALATLGIGQLGWLDVDWQGVASVSGLAALMSVLTSIASGGFGRGTASLVSEPASE
ncbi:MULTISPECIES: holin [Rhodococcus]|uniref:holin n=1 Tax=Rhodococcus TaxID=1827 RepID=UPI0007AEE0F4|nr:MULTISPECIES: holin [Rhodococcus]KZL33234.1 hypothetical protein A3852_13140 [Rhodococcus qingshengii]MBX9150107.1 Holin [Rhodococcus qingshengii]MCE4161606.1 Holin [Rhodococcus sp. Ni2]